MWIAHELAEFTWVAEEAEWQLHDCNLMKTYRGPSTSSVLTLRRTEHARRRFPPGIGTQLMLVHHGPQTTSTPFVTYRNAS